MFPPLLESRLNSARVHHHRQQKPIFACLFHPLSTPRRLHLRVRLTNALPFALQRQIPPQQSRHFDRGWLQQQVEHWRLLNELCGETLYEGGEAAGNISALSQLL